MAVGQGKADVRSLNNSVASWQPTKLNTALIVKFFHATI